MNTLVNLGMTEYTFHSRGQTMIEQKSLLLLIVKIFKLSPIFGKHCVFSKLQFYSFKSIMLA